MRVRDADAADAARVAALLGELGYPQGADAVGERIARLGASEDDRVLVAELDGNVVGVASLHLAPTLAEDLDWCRVTALVVAEAGRRRGVGRALMEEAERTARRRGCRLVEVTSGEFRGDAHAFYRRIGYRQVSRRFLKEI